MALQDLEAKYFAVQTPADAPEDQIPPVFRGTTVVTPIIDGANYFPQIHAAISATTGADDAVYVVGWRINPELNLLTGGTGNSADSVGHLLALKAGQGVDVRLVLNGTLALYWIPVPWAESLRNAELLRSLVPPGSSSPPLAQSVLFDWSGANSTGSQHQKAVVVRRGTEVTAFVGGMDFNPNIFDKAPHDELPIENSTAKWGWHDFGVKLEGEAAKRVLHNFRCRWHEASTLPEKLFKWQPGNETESPKPFNPAPMLPTPDAVPPDPAADDSNLQSVQVLRSRYKWKIPNRCGSGGTPWDGLPDEPATDGFIEIFNTMKKAIAAATRYIYVEDQFLMDSPPGGFVGDFAPLGIGASVPILLDGMNGLNYSLYVELLNALSAPNAFDLRLIFVGSGRKDPEDPGTTLRNQAITNSVRRIIDGLPAGRKGNVAVWRRDNKTVHSKLMIIDDEFMAVGSANFQSRSMAGVDNEIHVAIVADDDTVKDKRKELWSEHFKLDAFDGVPGVASGLDDIATALGLWGDGWYVADQAYWENRTGYNMVNGFGGLSPVLP